MYKSCSHRFERCLLNPKGSFNDFDRPDHRSSWWELADENNPYKIDNVLAFFFLRFYSINTLYRYSTVRKKWILVLGREIWTRGRPACPVRCFHQLSHPRIQSPFLCIIFWDYYNGFGNMNSIKHIQRIRIKEHHITFYFS